KLQKPQRKPTNLGLWCRVHLGGTMSKPILAVCACAILLVGFVGGWAANTKYGSGVGWGSLSHDEKVLFVRGYDAGYQETNMLADVIASKSGSSSQIAPLKKMARVLSDKKQGKHSLAEVVEAVDTFYRDLRNQPVCWEEATNFATMA